MPPSLLFANHDATSTNDNGDDQSDCSAKSAATESSTVSEFLRRIVPPEKWSIFFPNHAAKSEARNKSADGNHNDIGRNAVDMNNEKKINNNKSIDMPPSLRIPMGDDRNRQRENKAHHTKSRNASPHDPMLLPDNNQLFDNYTFDAVPFNGDMDDFPKQRTNPTKTKPQNPKIQNNPDTNIKNMTIEIPMGIVVDSIKSRTISNISPIGNVSSHVLGLGHRNNPFSSRQNRSGGHPDGDSDSSDDDLDRILGAIDDIGDDAHNQRRRRHASSKTHRSKKKCDKKAGYRKKRWIKSSGWCAHMKHRSKTDTPKPGSEEKTLNRTLDTGYSSCDENSVEGVDLREKGDRNQRQRTPFEESIEVEVGALVMEEKRSRGKKNKRATKYTGDKPKNSNSISIWWWILLGVLLAIVLALTAGLLVPWRSKADTVVAGAQKFTDVASADDDSLAPATITGGDTSLSSTAAPSVLSRISEPTPLPTRLPESSSIPNDSNNNGAPSTLLWKDQPPLWASPVFQPSVSVVNTEPPSITKSPSQSPSILEHATDAEPELVFLYDDDDDDDDDNVNSLVTLDMGPLIGHTTHESATLWAHYLKPAMYLFEEDYKLKVKLYEQQQSETKNGRSSKPTLKLIRTIDEVPPDMTRNNAVFCTIESLQPLTAYYYEMSILGRRVGRGSFRTAPVPPFSLQQQSPSQGEDVEEGTPQENDWADPMVSRENMRKPQTISPDESLPLVHKRDGNGDYAGVKFDYILASCMDRSEQPVQAVWDEIAYAFFRNHTNGKEQHSYSQHQNKKYPDFAILAGDTVYMKENIDVDERNGVNFNRLWERNKAQRTEPHFSDFIRNTPMYATWNNHDYGSEWSNVYQLGKEHSLHAFRSLWPTPRSGNNHNNNGIYYSFYWGDVHFIVTDDRWHRDPASGNRLGPEQTNWLQSELVHSRGTFKVVVIGSDIMERGWGSDLENIGDTVRLHSIDGVLFHAGDIHRNEYKRLNTGGFPYPVTQITSSGIAKVWRRPFVHISVDTTAREDPFLTASFYGASSATMDDESDTQWINNPNITCSSIRGENRDQEHSCTETIRLSDLRVVAS